MNDPMIQIKKIVVSCAHFPSDIDIFGLERKLQKLFACDVVFDKECDIWLMEGKFQSVDFSISHIDGEKIYVGELPAEAFFNLTDGFEEALYHLFSSVEG